MKTVSRFQIATIQVKRLLTGAPLIHCWADGLDEAGTGSGASCMRAWGHWGRHDFVPDDRIGFSFREEP